MTVLTPYVIEKNGRDERAMDIYSRLLQDRIIMMGSQVNDQVAQSLVAQLLFLQFDDPEADIHFYINSPGGSVTAGMAIYDTMQFIKPDVSTMCIGQACSMGAFLLTSGAEGKRFCTPNSRVMIHQPSGGAQGQASDIHIHAQEILKIRSRLNELMAHHTGRSVADIERDTERDHFLSADEAKEYGLVDDVLSRRQSAGK